MRGYICSFSGYLSFFSFIFSMYVVKIICGVRVVWKMLFGVKGGGWNMYD